MTAATALSSWVEHAAPALPLAIELWNGEHIGPVQPRVTIDLRSPAALKQLLHPSVGKIATAYVEGLIDIHGTLRDAVELVLSLGQTSVAGVRRKWFSGRHSRHSDRKAIQFHYDVSNDFYGLWLDRNRVYSCGYFHNPDDTLDQAQEQKLDHICRKLCLQRGERLLDIGCGWGGMILWAAQHYGAHCMGITLSQQQHDYVREQIRARKLEDCCEVRLLDYRDLEPDLLFDKISSIGMFEHVGRKNLPTYFDVIRRHLKPGGLVLNHGISASWMNGQGMNSGINDFIDRYVFPDGELVHVAEAQLEMGKLGLEIRDVECLRPHYAKTLWQWVERLDAHADEARRLVGEQAYRVWRVYMAGSALSFERGWISLHQILAGKPREDGTLPLPLTREHLYTSEPGLPTGGPRSESMIAAHSA
ncbi:MAG: class I SAM-dependent methyltransferase [Nevskiaceae bacterium]|nr:MAG: class I SAM-dependent methyltransferase [Nevskiaceae bacterium]TBR72700.1 MAG: class I SAM-dependent methyltransferase [Nevskiaceae bacterium]